MEATFLFKYILYHNKYILHLYVLKMTIKSVTLQNVPNIFCECEYILQGTVKMQPSVG